MSWVRRLIEKGKVYYKWEKIIIRKFHSLHLKWLAMQEKKIPSNNIVFLSSSLYSLYDTVSIKPSRKYYKSFDERVLFCFNWITYHFIQTPNHWIIMIGVGGFLFFLGLVLVLLGVCLMEIQVFEASFIGWHIEFVWGGKCVGFDGTIIFIQNLFTSK